MLFCVLFLFKHTYSQYHEKKHSYVKNCVFIVYSRLHGRYHELAPHLVPMDYTNDPDCKLPLALIVNMPELKVKKLKHLLYLKCGIKFCFVTWISFFLPVLCFSPVYQYSFQFCFKDTLIQTWHPPLTWTDT